MSPAAGKTEQLTLAVSGMTCAACQHHVEEALRGVPGVSIAEVSLLAGRAVVTYDPSTARLEAFVEAAHDAGYEASLPDTTGVAPEEDAEPFLKSRAGFALGAALLAMALPMGEGMTGTVRWLLAGLTLLVMFFASPRTYTRAWRAARHGTTNMSTLVALGTLAAFGYSLFATALPQKFVGAGLVPEVYFEAVLFILAFLLLGAWLDARARRRTTDALRGFQAMQPATALIVRDGVEVAISLAEVQAGDVLLVSPGDRIAVDGVVLDGLSTVDQSLLTGESSPVVRRVGDAVIGGTINLDALLTVRATTVGAAGTLAQMQRLLEQAQMTRAPMQKMADRASAVFVPVVMGVAAVTFAGWMGVGLLGTGAAGMLPRAMSAAVAVLVIACPCAMGLAVPTAVTVAIGRAAQLGILIKGGEALERLARVDTVAFDKTGTLTAGKPRIVEVWCAGGIEEASEEGRGLLGIAAGLERRANHPLGRAVVEYAEGLPDPAGEDRLEAVRVVPGRGVSGVSNGVAVLLGNEALLREAGMSLDPGFAGSGTMLHLAVGGRHVLTLRAEDETRGSSGRAVQELHGLGLVVHLLTGDRQEPAAAVAESVGIDPAHVHAGMLPVEKLELIRALQETGRRVAMVGDGLNDAAALAQSDAGFAIGSGTEMAREAGDVVLLSPESELLLTAVPDALRLARRTVRTMRQNLGWAVGYNLLGIPLAAGVFYPHFHMLLRPAAASAAMALSSISVLVNSLRLRRFR